MTTAARPTFAPARGGTGRGEGGTGDLSSLSKQYSSRDLPAHKTLKYREDGQNSRDDLRGRDFRKELEDRERAAREKRRGEKESSSGHKRARLDQLPASNLDADDPIDEDSDSSDDDEEDDTAALLAELNKIKHERAQEQAKKEEEKAAEEERIRIENITKGNPLLNKEGGADFKVKRRWDDDVVFKNCARGEDPKKATLMTLYDRNSTKSSWKSTSTKTVHHHSCTRILIHTEDT